jgi:hypothetical protein
MGVSKVLSSDIQVACEKAATDEESFPNSSIVLDV